MLTVAPASSMLAVGDRVAFKAGFTTEDLSDLAIVRLVGSRCTQCHTALLGRRHRCENCSSRLIDDAVFASNGTVYTYTVQRYPPPPPFPAPQPWRPRAVAWVDLDDQGPRILAPIDAPEQQVSIGLAVRVVFDIGWTDARGREVVSFVFRPTGSERTP